MFAFFSGVSMSSEKIGRKGSERQTFGGVNLINFFSLHTLNIFCEYDEHYQSVNNMQSGINWLDLRVENEKLNKLAFHSVFAVC